jgi:hypothetical protein
MVEWALAMLKGKHTFGAVDLGKWLLRGFSFRIVLVSL